jgi:hypothetical protein
MLNRTFGCVRVVWNRTLAARRAHWQAERTSTSYAQTDADPPEEGPGPGLCSRRSATSTRHSPRSSPRRARHPRFKSRRGRQAAHYTRRAFTMCGRGRRVEDLDTAAVLSARRAERRRRLAEPDLEFRAFYARNGLPASSTMRLERAWDAWQAERYPRGEISHRPAGPGNPSGHADDHPGHSTHWAVQETGRLSGADGSVLPAPQYAPDQPRPAGSPTERAEGR